MEGDRADQEKEEQEMKEENFGSSNVGRLRCQERTEMELAKYPTLENNFPCVSMSVCVCVTFITFSTHPPMCVCPFVRSSHFQPSPKRKHA